MRWTERFSKAWNVFRNQEQHPDESEYHKTYLEIGSSQRPDNHKLRTANERSIINAVLTRMAVDCASCTIRHVRLDDQDRFYAYYDSGLDNCLTIEANIDQTGRAFLQDGYMSMFDEGVVALVPTNVSVNPKNTESYRIHTMRTAKVKEWYPYAVRLDCYDDRVGYHKEFTAFKSEVAIIQNPFYSVMNTPNSTLSRLIRKLNLLDTIDNKTGSDKLDLIIQLPYPVKTDLQREKAQQRLEDIEDQVSSSKYGIAYIDSSEHITQLNRAVENNLLKQVEYLIDLFYSQMGITKEIMNGTADESAMQNYYARMIEPCVAAFCDELKRKFLTETARTQGQSIMFFRDPFKIVPVGSMADIADKFTRNAILSSNEVRGIIGRQPVDDPDADALRNKNLNQSSDELSGENGPPDTNITKQDAESKPVGRTKATRRLRLGDGNQATTAAIGRQLVDNILRR